MNSTIEEAYKAIEIECNKFKKKYPDISFDDSKIDIFSKCFKKNYEYIIKTYMKNTSVLDAHKQAAIITISCLESGIIIDTYKGQNTFSILRQLIAVNVGLSFMNDMLNELLKNKHIKKEIDEYTFPIAIVCDTPYMEIMCRLLYYEETDNNMNFNILELSDRYFLIEYITLLQNGIEPSLLK